MINKKVKTGIFNAFLYRNEFCDIAHPPLSEEESSALWIKKLKETELFRDSFEGVTVQSMELTGYLNMSHCTEFTLEVKYYYNGFLLEFNNTIFQMAVDTLCANIFRMFTFNVQEDMGKERDLKHFLSGFRTNGYINSDGNTEVYGKLEKLFPMATKWNNLCGRDLLPEDFKVYWNSKLQALYLRNLRKPLRNTPMNFVANPAVHQAPKSMAKGKHAPKTTDKRKPEVQQAPKSTDTGKPAVKQAPKSTDKRKPAVQQAPKSTDKRKPAVQQAPKSTDKHKPAVQQVPKSTDKRKPAVKQAPKSTDTGKPAVKQAPKSTDTGKPAVKQAPKSTDKVKTVDRSQLLEKLQLFQQELMHLKKIKENIEGVYHV